MLNDCKFIGNWTKSPELRYTASGTAVTSATLAVNQQFKDKKETLYIDVIIWGKNGENVAQYTDKGSRVLVSGRLVIRSYEGKDGKRWVTEVVAENVRFLDKGKSEATGQSFGTEVTFNDQDIPF